MAESVDLTQAVDVIGNSPAKMATLLIIAAQQPDALSLTGLAKAFDAVQGDEPGWKLGRKYRSVPFAYCEQLIAPTFLDETRISALPRINAPQGGRTVKAYRLNQRGFDEGVPLCGAGLSWELEYKDTSGAFLLGASNSLSRDERMPSLRVRLYEQLLAAPEGRSQAELYQAVGEAVIRVMQLIPNLRDLGILESGAPVNPGDWHLMLSEPDLVGLNADPPVLPEVAAIYALARELFEQGKTTLSGQEFLDALRAQHPQFDPKAVWNKVRTARDDKLPFITPVSLRSDIEQIYTIAPDYENSIAALVGFIRKLEVSAAYRDEMREAADDIIHDPHSMAELMGKSHKYSQHMGGESGGRISDDEQAASWPQAIAEHIPVEGIDPHLLYSRVVPKDNPITFTHFRRLLQKHEGSEYQIVWAEGRGKLLRRRIARIVRRTE